MEQDRINQDGEPTKGTDPLEGMKGAAGAAGKTMVAAALAGAVATGAAAVTPDDIHLTDPVPIVQTVDTTADLPDSTVDDQEQKKASAVKRILEILKYVLIALFVAAAFLFGVLQGCASCTGQLAAPVQSSESSNSAVDAGESSADSQAAKEAA